MRSDEVVPGRSPQGGGIAIAFPTVAKGNTAYCNEVPVQPRDYEDVLQGDRGKDEMALVSHLECFAIPDDDL